MNLFSESFLNDLRIAIVEVVKDALISMNKNKVSETRYLKKKEAKKYIGGVNDVGFEKLISNGLQEIRIDGILRYDKQDIDELMAKFKI